jgi:hypothetical protein
MSTETVKLVNIQGIQDIVERLEGMEETPQTAVDILFVALLVCHSQGIEPESVYEIIPQIWKQSGKVSERIFGAEGFEDE